MFMLKHPWSRHDLLHVKNTEAFTESPVAKNQINLIVHSSHKTDKNITANASQADVHSNSTVKL